ncbi:MAG: hypothetical protein KBT21_08485, partial [Treponema sp.]|nr:hypothetical protein [Candidatus Treponema merdequi]
MKVNKLLIITAFTAIFSDTLILTGCGSKNSTSSKTENIQVSGGINEITVSKSKGDILLEYDENDENLKAVNIESFYKKNGHLIDTVFIKNTSAYAIPLNSNDKEFFTANTVVKLIALNSKKALILLPPSRCINKKSPVYAVINSDDLTPANYIPTTSYEHEISISEYYDLLNSHEWYGFFTPAKKLLNTDNAFGIFHFMTSTDDTTSFTFANSDGALTGTYNISYNGDSNELQIKIFDNQNNYYDDSTDSTSYIYYIRGNTTKSYISLSYPYEGQNDLFYNIDFTSTDKLNNYEFVDLCRHNNDYFFDTIDCIDPCSQYLFSNPKNKVFIQNLFIKFGLYINSKTYLKNYDEYWNPIMKNFQTTQCPAYNISYDTESNNNPFTTVNEEDYYTANVIQNPNQLTVEDVFSDYETLKKFYYKDSELYPYAYIHEDSERYNKNINIYKSPDINSEVVFTENFFMANISAIGKKATVNGQTSHWVEIVLPRFIWKSNEPEYGWVFGTNVHFDKDFKYPFHFSWSLLEEKNNINDFDYDPLYLSQNQLDPIFSKKDLYDINEGEHSSYHRYLLTKDTTLSGELEFIKSGVYAHIRYPDDEIEKCLYLEEIVNSNQQHARSLYPVFIKDVPNLTDSKNHPVVKSELNGFTFETKNSEKVFCRYPYNYIKNNVYYSTIKNKASLIKADIDKDLFMVYHSYVDFEYRIHDSVTLIECSHSGESKVIYSWNSIFYDVISQTKTNVIFVDDNPKLIVQQLNGTLR